MGIFIKHSIDAVSNLVKIEVVSPKVYAPFFTKYSKFLILNTECLTGCNNSVEKDARACAKVAELVDAQASGACARMGVGVRVPPFANTSMKAV